jgi:steroid 5-alpha reductase family enzyme
MSSGAAVSEAWLWVGLVLMVTGVLLEATADAQKNAAKKINPKRFVDTGVYRLVRCPNYLGERIIWTGSFVVCFGASCSWWQWLVAAVGYLGIVYVMFSGARRLELRQQETYGNNPQFRAYIKQRPLLIPLLPIYSLAKFKWLKA